MQEMSRLSATSTTACLLYHVWAGKEARELIKTTINMLQSVIAEKAQDWWDKLFHLDKDTFCKWRRLMKLLNEEKEMLISQGHIWTELTIDAAPSHGWESSPDNQQQGVEIQWGMACEPTAKALHRNGGAGSVVCLAALWTTTYNTKLLVQPDCTVVVWNITQKRAGSKTL